MYRCVVVVVVFAAALAPTRVSAAQFTVTRVDDPVPDGCQPTDCSLREAVIAANISAGPDTVVVPADTYRLTRANAAGDENTAQTGDLDLTGDVAIIGAPTGGTVVQAGLAEAKGIDRVFDVIDADVRIADLTIRFGTLTNDCGGGINLAQATLLLERSTLERNRAAFGSAICNEGTLTVSHSVLDSNAATFSGSIINYTCLTIIASTLVNNSAGGQGGAIYNLDAPLAIRDSSLTRNSALGGGGGIYNASPVSLVNTTLSENLTAGNGGGLFATTSSRATLINSTVSGNVADYNLDGSGTGGGVYQAGGGNGTTTLRNTLLAGNQASLQFLDLPYWIRSANECSGPLQSDGYALVQASSPASCPISGAVLVADPLLGPLTNNGGPTETRLPAAGSPAIDAGNPAGCTDADGQPLSRDQRGVARPQGLRCDLGAVEVEQAAPPPSPPPPPSPAPSTAPSAPGSTSGRILVPLVQR